MKESVFTLFALQKFINTYKRVKYLKPCMACKIINFSTSFIHCPSSKVDGCVLYNAYRNTK